MSTDFFSAFANKTRLKIILCLNKGPKNVTELIDNCGLSQSAVSQHLTKLKEAEVVTDKNNGKNVYYSLKEPKAGQAAELIWQLYKNR